MSVQQASGFVTDLRAAGYAVLPMPRTVELAGGSVRIDANWGLALSSLDEGDIAVRTLCEGLDQEHGLDLTDSDATAGVIELAVRAGGVDPGTGDPRDDQAYVIEILADKVALTGNALPGLYYAVQTLLQLLEGNGIERGVVPLGRIVDWPRYELRLNHWDTKHHQDRMETLKRYLDWCGRFKINGILFELEDKFEYPSHPTIGAPGAFTTAELQELTDYALERHIQIVPDVQSPAHMCYVLKHEEFAHLRCDGSNYQSCMDEPAVRQFLFEMYDDVCEATQGAKYFHVSTDEIYYAGICEKFRQPYNPENRSATVVDYVKAAHQHLSKKGRQVIIWLEYPTIDDHIKLMPEGLLNGIGFRKAVRVQEENKRNIRQFAYCPIQGSELTFPNYFAYTDPVRGRSAGRLVDAFNATLEGRVANGNPIGTICAAWDDAGHHNEVFWLGWATMAQGGWTPGTVDVAETAETFMEIYYGREVVDMVEVYCDLQAAARFFEYTLEKLPSTVRGPSYGHPSWKGQMERYDRTMVPPAAPAIPNDTSVSVNPQFGPRYAKALAEAPQRLADIDRLLARLHADLPRARRNRYNIEVLISLAHYLRHFVEMIQAVAEAEEHLHQAAIAGKSGSAQRALASMLRARNTITPIITDLYATYQRLKAVWEKSRFEKGQSVDGRHFVHVMDDVKDHVADRRPDLTYLLAPEERLDLKGWVAKLDEVMDRYAAATGLTASLPERVPVDED